MGGTGKGESYNSLANDLENVKYSSMRSGKLDEQQNYKIEQKTLVDIAYTEIAERFIKNAVLNGAVKLDYGNIDNLTLHEWQPRTYPWVDPMKDVQAALLEINSGLKSRGDVIKERYGKDIKDVRAKIKKEREDDLAAGLDFVQVKEITTSTNTNQNKEDDEEYIYNIKWGKKNAEV